MYSPSPSRSRGFSLFEKNRAESNVQNDSLDLARHWLELKLHVVVKGHGGGIADHVDVGRTKDLPLASGVHLESRSTRKQVKDEETYTRVHIVHCTCI